MAFDVAVIGGGIIGTAAAAYLAEAGQSVVIIERAAIADGASGRNSGVLQLPPDPALAELHRASLALYTELADADPEFELGRRPAGLLLVGREEQVSVAALAALAHDSDALDPQLLGAPEARRLEPALGEGIAAIRLATGYPVVPAAATHSFARRAERAGVRVRLGGAARLLITGSRAAGIVLHSGERLDAGQVLVAAGPWTAALVDGWQQRPPIRPIWGVVAATHLDDPPRHVLEEWGIEPGAQDASALFSLVTAGGVSSVGSTFVADRPVPSAVAPALLARAASFVPALADVTGADLRACARPVSFDGRPLIGPVPGAHGLFVCAGHGPWGMSTGPASARLVVDLMLGAAEPLEPQSPFAVDRWPARGPEAAAAVRR
ncbi:FAD-dependent oxidoreductase [soil metagenome]